MRHSSRTLHCTAAILTGWLWCLCAVSRPSLSDLRIRVMLSENGDARITETRHMHVDSEGTEVYVVVSHLGGGSRVTDLGVTDESGLNYTYIGEWDVDRSRAEKSGRCGIVTKSDGYELCWGLGDSGERTYITSYTVTNMVKGYEDADGFNYMFVAEGISPEPEHVSLVISRADGKPFAEDTAAIWAFRYDGYVAFDNGNIVAETTEPFDRHSAMIVMARFPHGFFAPEMTQGGTFDEVKERAFEGSDYNDDDFDIVGIIIFICIIVGLPLLFIAYLIYMWWQRRKVTKDLEWWRDIPLGGKLQEANKILNAYRYFGSNYDNLLSACILRLINIGAISIEPTTDKNGKLTQNFVIHDLPEVPQQERMVEMIHDIFRQAAGDDTILEPRELRSWMQSRENQSVTDSFVQTLHTPAHLYKYANANSRQSVQQLFGLKKYLKDFSLLNERHVGELTLWKEYMIYATLFGIADQVIRDMKRINPEYFKMDDIASQMADDMTLPTIYSTFHNSTSRAWMSKAEREARASGRGGRASFGGGGGFSGGGFGGGVR